MGRAELHKAKELLSLWGLGEQFQKSVEPVSGTNAQLTRGSAEHNNLEMKPKTGA